MPELPEVETIRRGLQASLTGKKITSVEVLYPGILRSPLPLFIRTLQRDYVMEVARQGKVLIFRLQKSGRFVLIHLRMTGQLIYTAPSGVVAGGHSLSPHFYFPGVGERHHCHVIFTFADDSQLFFYDMRKFGFMKLVDEKGKREFFKNIGKDPLSPDFSFSFFREVLDRKRGGLKPFFLNQSFVSGIGNIYADEICFDAGFRPERKIETLSEAELKKLYVSCKNIIRKAVRHRGTTFRNFMDTEGRAGGFLRLLKVYGRAGEKCLRCEKGIIEKRQYAGRGTSFCATCQV